MILLSINHKQSKCFFFFLNDPATTEFSPLPLPAALPIWMHVGTSLARLSHNFFLKPAARYNNSDPIPAHRPLKTCHSHVCLPICRLVPWSRASSSARRSEEHTSELQSQSNLVCRLLLEKK